jgi:hypothetical protein
MAFKDLFKSKYKTNVWCNNCNCFSEVQIPRGVTVNQFIESGACPACGCATLVAGYKQIDEFKEQSKPKIRLLMRKQNVEPIQRAPLPQPRPSNRPANLLPRRRPQPSAEPDFTPKGVFGNTEDIDFWTGNQIKKRGDEDED